MAVVDDRGRIGGKVNLIDAVIAVVVLGLIPVAYGAYLLFRTPTPKLLSVSPSTLYQGNNLRVTITGENLRPYLRVTFNGTQGQTFLIGNTTFAYVDLPELKPGAYDVDLWDYRQDLSTLRKGLTILPLAPTPTMQIDVKGTFKGLSSDRLSAIKVGDRFPATGDAQAVVVSVGSAVPSAIQVRAGASLLTVPLGGRTDLQAVLRVQCFAVSNADGSVRCAIAGPVQQVDVAPGSMLPLNGADGSMSFQISEVLPPAEKH
ncbi:MAG TPA: DUF4330 family protein [Vicinamibacterales bacterium]|nr:DUF4330 family protein [Vicinamibacterales bacterium]